MPSFRDMVYGLYGAFRLARLDPGGMTYFEQTVEGFWKSFFAAALVAPGYALLVLFDLSARESDAGLLRILIVQLCAYSLSWTAYPLIMHHVCESMGRQPAYVGFIVAFNWAKVIQMAVYLPAVLIVATGVLPGGLAALLNAAVYLVLLGYQWFVTRTALDLAGLGAVGLVVLDVLIGIIISALADGMIH